MSLFRRWEFTFYGRPLPDCGNSKKNRKQSFFQRSVEITISKDGKKEICNASVSRVQHRT
nr:hypothetical protein Cduv_198 [Cedratvirus duvanny]